MKPELRFEDEIMKVSQLGEEACVPDILGSMILQNDLEFQLDEEDEIFEAYGRKDNSYPYRQYNTYNRELEETKVKTAVLENDYLTAVFLPGFGGRLWRLTDKKTGQNLLYTNDVIRFSNLAIRNAWFSGGVEWNIGIIGHSPLTTEQMFTARLTDEEGNPILRMYMYEQVREVEYQMDFWLGMEDRYLNCRMRIVNSSKEVVPMYWWSNMAVPEYDGGRIAVPAREAFTSKNKKVMKVKIPVVDGVDVTRYKNIPQQVDYFFHIPKEAPKYIANLNREGYGLLQMSSARLQARKLFSWGNNEGGDRWQEFLTENAGRYLEIQAGIGKTQYGCIPMPPHSAWEWVEQYGPVTLEGGHKDLSFEELEGNVTELVNRIMEDKSPDQIVIDTKRMAKQKGELLYEGDGSGALKRIIREMEGERQLSGHLDYGQCQGNLTEWKEFLETGSLKQKDMLKKPGAFQCDDFIYQKLKESMKGKNKDSWYAWYHLGLMELDRKKVKKAMKAFRESLKYGENPWTLHGLVSACLIDGKKERATKLMVRGTVMMKENLSYVKEGFRLLLMAEGYEEVVRLYQELPGGVKQDRRIFFFYLTALSYTGRAKEAYGLLMDKEDIVPEDLREGEESLGSLYVRLYREVYHKEPEKIPGRLNFSAGEY